jgi:hypothetical protein
LGASYNEYSKFYGYLYLWLTWTDGFPLRNNRPEGLNDDEDEDEDEDEDDDDDEEEEGMGKRMMMMMMMDDDDGRRRRQPLLNLRYLWECDKPWRPSSIGTSPNLNYKHLPTKQYSKRARLLQLD